MENNKVPFMPVKHHFSRHKELKLNMLICPNMDVLLLYIFHAYFISVIFLMYFYNTCLFNNVIFTFLFFINIKYLDESCFSGIVFKEFH